MMIATILLIALGMILVERLWPANELPRVGKLRGIYGFLPFGTGRRPTRCFLGTLQRAAGNDQVHPPGMVLCKER